MQQNYELADIKSEYRSKTTLKFVAGQILILLNAQPNIKNNYHYSYSRKFSRVPSKKVIFNILTFTETHNRAIICMYKWVY